MEFSFFLGKNLVQFFESHPEFRKIMRSIMKVLEAGSCFPAYCLPHAGSLFGLFLDSEEEGDVLL
jgi:hypothetical protein